MTRKHPENDNPNVQTVHELAGSWHCKERSDGIAIVTLCVNRVRSYLRTITLFIYLVKVRYLDEEQGNTHPKQNPTYK